LLTEHYHSADLFVLGEPVRRKGFLRALLQLVLFPLASSLHVSTAFVA
jgi:hypothetical protein